MSEPVFLSHKGVSIYQCQKDGIFSLLWYSTHPDHCDQSGVISGEAFRHQFDVRDIGYCSGWSKEEVLERSFGNSLGLMRAWHKSMIRKAIQQGAYLGGGDD